ncbi:MAG TPA: ATP-binding protein [Candidatus Omnitrophota bacterium]|nr:ATP-binding protein [Candidatus Omnitrophota bacterium]HSA30553.1 ATP-binding protein [Candidatus Omnitrophota bacterium]
MKTVRSLTLKLTLSYLLIIFISFGFVAFFLEKNFEKNAMQEIKASLMTQAGLIADQISAESLIREDIPRLAALVDRLKDRTDCRITIVSSQGRVLADSQETPAQIGQMENHAKRPEIRAALSGSTGAEVRYSVTLKKDMLYVALPLRGHGEIIGAVRLALIPTQVEKILGTARKTIAAGVLVAFCLALVLGVYFIARAVRPIKRMIQVSRKLSGGDYSRRIISTSQDEIAELASTLNTMAQRTEEKTKEADARNQQLEAVFHGMVEGVVVIDRSGKVLSINPAFERIFGIPDKDIVGRPFLEVVRNNDMVELMNAVLREGKPVSREIPFVLPVRKIFQINAAPVFEGGSISGCLAVIHDITEIKRLETMRKDFVANVSHELKTPLTTIKGFIETLLAGALEDRQNNRNFLKIIEGQVERLNTLVNDLLSLACLESKEIVFRREKVDLSRLADAALTEAQSQWQKMKLTVRNELPPGLYVAGDMDKLTQVLSNLIDNAIKFNTDNGVLTISCQDLGSHVKICVEDTGIGIPEKDLPRLFERFYRVDRARSRELGGTGLGLSIVKHIVEKHRGEVGVESVEGTGSKFWFTLPKA